MSGAWVVHPDALLASLDSRQLGEWYAFLQIEPIGEMREDFRAGMICSTVANYAGRQRAENAGPAQPAQISCRRSKRCHGRRKPLS